MVIKNGKAPARRKSASSSAKSSRSNIVSKGSVRGQHIALTNKLDGAIDCTEATALESEAGDRILETARIDDGAPRVDISTESVELNELTAITLIQPWASLIAGRWKQYETRDWPTNYRGLIAIHAGRKPKGKELREHNETIASFNDLLTEDCPYSSIIAIAEMTDCVLMTEDFINQQSPTELRCGDYQVGRYAFKLENVRAIKPIPATGKQGLWKWNSDSWNPADFGELHHVAEADGQLNLLDWTDKEPPEPDDYDSIELFDQAYKQWEDSQQSAVNSQQLKDNSEELCSILMDGSICVQELVPASHLPELNCGKEVPTTSASGTTIATQFLEEDTQTANNDSATSKQSSLHTHNSAVEYNLSLLHRLANPSQLMENDLPVETIETASPTCSEQLETCSPNSQLLKTLLDSSTAPIPPAINPEAILGLSSTPYRQTGTMQNGSVLGLTSSPLRGVGKECLLLRSPGALSSTGKASPPGKTRLENQLLELGLISTQEVVAPEFLELGYQLPIGFTNLQENRTALELAQQQPIVPKSELSVEMVITAIDVQPWEMPLIGESQPLDYAGSNTLIQLPANIGALTKDELLVSAIEQHQLINIIERTEFELGIEKLHRARLTGIYFQEFKKRCRHGEFETELENSGIKPRRAQQYMSIAKNWNAIEAEAKAQTVALLVEENQSFGIKWALDTIASQKKLKSAAPPADPDCWRTPNTRDQPIVDLVQQALGGEIWVDPCSCSGSKIPAKVRYYKDEDGLKDCNHWNKTAFINPPFSDPLPWVEKCSLSIARGNLRAAIMLLKAGTVSNVGTGKLIEKYASAICHWRGRINYLNDEGKVVKGSDFDCVLLYFGDRFDLFKETFEPWGTIATIDNHYSSVNKKFLEDDKPSFPGKPAFPDKPDSNSIREEQKQLAAAVGLSSGKSVLPDRRDRDRDLLEQYDPHTVIEVPQVSENLLEAIERPAIFEETATIVAEFNQAKQNCLNDYIIAISSNLSDFSDDQIAFLAKIINEESIKRIGF